MLSSRHRFTFMLWCRTGVADLVVCLLDGAILSSFRHSVVRSYYPVTFLLCCRGIVGDFLIVLSFHPSIVPSCHCLLDEISPP